MNLTNYHSHCNFCDGKASIEEFVKSAISAGFTAYGVSSHAPLPFTTRWTIVGERVPAYLKELGELKKKYAGEIELYSGMEIDYLSDTQNASIPYFQDLPLDYRIGSVHLIYTDEGEIVDTDTNCDNFRQLVDQYFKGDTEQAVVRYFDASMRMVEAGGFDFIGHTDKISWNAEYSRQGVTSEKWYERKREDLFAAIARKGLMMEINTKAFQTRGCFFPGREHFALIGEMGIPVIVNSDAHLPALVNAGRPEALRALKEAGFRSVRELHAGKWVEVEINEH